MKVHLLDGTYELFRHHFGAPASDHEGREDVAATRGVLGSVLSLFEQGSTHLAVATDHVVESFRNDRWPGYKSSAGMPEPLLAQFPLLEPWRPGAWWWGRWSSWRPTTPWPPAPGRRPPIPPSSRW
jgi:5'-3' exonuclease